MKELTPSIEIYFNSRLYLYRIQLIVLLIENFEEIDL